jgi:hypothetical protein
VADVPLQWDESVETSSESVGWEDTPADYSTIDEGFYNAANEVTSPQSQDSGDQAGDFSGSGGDASSPAGNDSQWATEAQQQQADQVARDQETQRQTELAAAAQQQADQVARDQETQRQTELAAEAQQQQADQVARDQETQRQTELAAEAQQQQADQVARDQEAQRQTELAAEARQQQPADQVVRDQEAQRQTELAAEAQQQLALVNQASADSSYGNYEMSGTFAVDPKTGEMSMDASKTVPMGVGTDSRGTMTRTVETDSADEEAHLLDRMNVGQAANEEAHLPNEIAHAMTDNVEFSEDLETGEQALAHQESVSLPTANGATAEVSIPRNEDHLASTSLPASPEAGLIGALAAVALMKKLQKDKEV